MSIAKLTIAENFNEEGCEDGTFSVYGTGALCELYDDEMNLDSLRDAEAFAQEWVDMAKEEGIEFSVEACTDVHVW